MHQKYKNSHDYWSNGFQKSIFRKFKEPNCDFAGVLPFPFCRSENNYRLNARRHAQQRDGQLLTNSIKSVTFVSLANVTEMLVMSGPAACNANLDASLIPSTRGKGICGKETPRGEGREPEASFCPCAATLTSQTALREATAEPLVVLACFEGPQEPQYLEQG